MDRPSYKEIYRRLKKAKEAVSKNRISFINPINIAADALELGFRIEEIAEALSDLLEEITPNDYVGQFPPQRSYEDDILQLELFPFQWLSRRLGCRVYLKFATKEDRLWLVSLHQTRKKAGVR